jgi:trimethylamine--corrinoid protein Co-methyltransferase
LVDTQAGVESALSLYAAALGGVNFIYDAAGSLDGSVTISYEKVILDNEVCGMVTRLLKGIEVTDETLAVDEICKVGSAGSYLGTMFTMKNFRKEHFVPSLMERRSMDAWTAAGKKDIVAVAKEKVKQVLKEHEVPPIEKDVFKEAEAYFRKVVRGYG